MRHLIYPCLMLLTGFLLSACEMEIGGSDQDESKGSSLVFKINSGVQTDIFHQKTDVIQDDDSFYELMASIPTMSGMEPEFNSETDTLVSILSNSVSCSYYPKVKDVFDDFGTIIIEVVNIRVKNPETCDPTGIAAYSYKMVKINKTGKPISITIRNES